MVKILTSGVTAIRNERKVIAGLEGMDAGVRKDTIYIGMSLYGRWRLI